MIPLSGVAGLLQLSQPDTEVITRRADFPSPVLVLPEYVYWDQTEIENWFRYLHISLDELRALIGLTRPDLDNESEREHFYLEQQRLEDTDDADYLRKGGFSIDGPLPPEPEDDADRWLEEFGD